MISLPEIRSALQGSWLLFKNRPEGLRYFDLSISGFWRSFGAILPLTPLFVLTALAERKLVIEEAELDPEILANAYWPAQFTSYLVDWVTLPLILAALAGPLGISKGYVPFIVARNWTSLLASLFYVVPALLYLLGVIPSGILVLLSLVALMVIIRYRYIVARMVLECTVSVAVGLVILDIVLSILIGELASRLWGF